MGKAAMKKLIFFLFFFVCMYVCVLYTQMKKGSNQWLTRLREGGA